MAKPEPDKLTPEEVVERFRGRITLKTLSNWRLEAGAGPPFTKVGGAVLYPLEELKQWERDRTFSSTKDYGRRQAQD